MVWAKQASLARSPSSLDCLEWPPKLNKQRELVPLARLQPFLQHTRKKKRILQHAEGSAAEVRGTEILSQQHFCLLTKGEGYHYGIMKPIKQQGYVSLC